MVTFVDDLNKIDRRLENLGLDMSLYLIKLNLEFHLLNFTFFYVIVNIIMPSTIMPLDV